ncbi:hypothetical protein [Stutzerimonas stutzeri]|uniref:hypothetical protein n=1 Tax=Stutzerimonas stutzeri TaxID=316 RepID=UPI0015E2934A|nr:hypothetical protein [Stutzerimonas stutzeri]MBA1278823.1 hypothetical protein [Stutzerimonas stutzeri]
MQRIYLIQQNLVSRLKQRARRIKRDKNVPHHEALELAAKAVGFDNWHQVVSAAEMCRPTEEAFRRGFLIAYDPSEVPDIESEDFPLLWERDASYLLKEQLFECYGSQLDEEDAEERPIFETLDLNELREYFEDDWQSMHYFRLKCPSQASSIEQLLDLVHEHSFWLPRYVFAKGKLVDTSSLPALNTDGDIVGIRF